MKIKTINTIIAFLIVLSSANAGLIISQYIETNSGTSPKGIELWNTTGDTIDFAVTPLTVYAARTSGGSIGDFGSSTTANDTVTVNTGTLADNAVMVIGTADMGTAVGTGVLFVLNDWYFNGDDALQVQLNGVVQDTFGQGNTTDPGTTWGTDATVKTQNLNLALKAEITTGDIDGWTDPTERFEVVVDSTGSAVVPNATDGLTGFGLAPTGTDSSGGDTGGGDTGGGDTGGGDTGGGDTGGGDTGGGDTGGGDTGGGDTGGGDTGGGDTGGGDTGGGDTGGGDTGGGDTGGGLIISQYIETNSGTSPKGIELWNTTGDIIDFAVTPLTVYAARTSGGSIGDFGSSTTENDTFTLNTGTLPDNAVMVIGSENMGTYLTGLSNVLYINVYFHLHSWFFNGDDALQVQLNGVVQDTFGQDNTTDPGSTWGTDATVKTLNLNLALKSGITTGDVDGWTDPTERFEVVTGSGGVAVVPNATDGLTGFGLAPTGTDSSGGDTGGGDTGGGDTGGGDTGGGDTGGDTNVQLIITGVFDGPLSGGTPKGVELYALEDIADLSVYGIGSANNGGGTDGAEYIFSGSVTAGQYFYVVGTGNEDEFGTFFGIDLTAVGAPLIFTSGAMFINGDDAIELFDVTDQAAPVAIDTYGDINVDGNGETWEYLDGWAYRNNNAGTAISTTYTSSDWSYSGPDSFDGATDNATSAAPFPIGTYTNLDPNADSDGDGVSNDLDAFPNDPTETVDTDGDGTGDNSDAFPNDSTETADTDGDGTGDNSDAFPNDSTETADTDGDGIGDNSDVYEGYDDGVIGNFLTDFPQSGGGGLTQQDLLDARVGSTAVSVTDGTATITIQVEQSDDNMATWTTPSEGATTVDLPVTGDASFFRVRAQ